MRFLMTFRDRRTGPDPAAAGRRAVRLLDGTALPPGVKLHVLLSRVGGDGGYAVIEAAEAEGLQTVAALLPGFECRVEPVVDLVPGYSRAGAVAGAPALRTALPEMPASEPHEGAFSDDDVYDWED